jgi:hypothetical protein
MHRLGHLHGELAGRHEDQGARRFAVGGPEPGDPLEDRQGEGGGFAGAGRGLAEEVTSGDQRRNRLTLNGRRLFVPQLGQRTRQARIEPQAGESR